MEGCSIIVVFLKGIIMRVITVGLGVAVLLGVLGCCGAKKRVAVPPETTDPVATIPDEVAPQPGPIPEESFGPTPTDITFPDLTDLPREPEVRYHTVEKGDTIWNLAEQYLGDGHRADEIAAVNPDIKDPVNALPLGKEIVIPAK